MANINAIINKLVFAGLFSTFLMAVVLLTLGMLGIRSKIPIFLNFVYGFIITLLVL